MTNYLERFKKMVEELENDPRISVEEFNVEPPATDEQIKKANKKFKLTEAMREFYKQANGITLEWRTNDTCEDEYLKRRGGSIKLLPVDKVFDKWKGYWGDNKEFKHFHPIDYYTDDSCAGLKLHKTKDPDVYLQRDELETLNLKFEDYLNLLIKSRGYYSWRSAIVSDIMGEERTTGPIDFRVTMPKLFNDFNVKDFLKNDYSAKDNEKIEKLTSETDFLKKNMDSFGIEYTINPSFGGIEIQVKNDKEQLKNLVTILKIHGDFSGILDDDTGAMNVGHILVEKPYTYG